MGTKANKIRVVYFSRKPRTLGNFSAESYFKSIRENIGENFICIDKKMPFYNSGFFKRLGNAIFCLFSQGDINHITGDIHYVAAFLDKSKTILTVLDCGMLYESSGFKHRLFKFFWFKMPVKKSVHITAISNATKLDVIKFTGCNESKISVMYVCIDPAFTKREKPFNVAEPRILQIGTNTNKNLDRLILALKGINCRLVIIGKVDERLIQLLVANEINHEIKDWQLTSDEIREEYKKCDLLSFVSTLEGFGMPIVEANAVGRVVITGNVTSMPEVAGNAAHLVDPFSIAEIHDGFVKIINDQTYRDKLIENGLENCKRFSIETISDQFRSLYTMLTQPSADATDSFIAIHNN
jgi:glycosyltransferase involved in cell wall biosynthesis